MEPTSHHHYAPRRLSCQSAYDGPDGGPDARRAARSALSPVGGPRVVGVPLLGPDAVRGPPSRVSARGHGLDTNELEHGRFGRHEQPRCCMTGARLIDDSREPRRRRTIPQPVLTVDQPATCIDDKISVRASNGQDTSGAELLPAARRRTSGLAAWTTYAAIPNSRRPETGHCRSRVYHRETCIGMITWRYADPTAGAHIRMGRSGSRLNSMGIRRRVHWWRPDPACAPLRHGTPRAPIITSPPHDR